MSRELFRNPLNSSTCIVAVFISFALIAPQVVTAEDVTVKVEIKSIDPTRRTITVIHSGKTIQRDFSRKFEVAIKGVPSEIGSVHPGDSATVVYHKELELVTKIVADGNGTQKAAVEFVELSEINGDGAMDPWVSSDGLTIYWTSEKRICTAQRKDAASFFEGKKTCLVGVMQP